MNIVIVYDSYFNNTKAIAEAMAEVTDPLSMKLLQASEADAKILSQADLLIIGSPTRAFKPATSISKLLKDIPKGSLKATKTAAFDTRIDIKKVQSKLLEFMVGIFGYAAEKIDKKLVKKGGKSVALPEGFIVTDKEGPLKEGEALRASHWIQTIIDKI
jgi:flavodoxin